MARRRSASRNPPVGARCRQHPTHRAAARPRAPRRAAWSRRWRPWACASGRRRSAAARSCPRRAGRRTSRAASIRTKSRLGFCSGSGLVHQPEVDVLHAGGHLGAPGQAEADDGVDLVGDLVQHGRTGDQHAVVVRVRGERGQAVLQVGVVDVVDQRPAVLARRCRGGPSGRRGARGRSARRPGQPWSTRRHAAGTALIPHRAPSRAPAIAATVSVSWPMRIAVVSESTR